MSPVRITAWRTIGYARNAYATAFEMGAFLAIAMASFAFNLEAAEGTRLSAAVAWASSLSPVLPVLAAFLGMDTWSEERRSGRMGLILSSPVSEFDFTLGKFLGTWVLSLAALALCLVSSIVLLRVYAPACDILVLPFAVAFLTLALQSALWSAVSVMCSACFRGAAVAAGATILLLVGLPRGIWMALQMCSPKGASAYGVMPLDAHAIDLASGAVSCGTVAFYLVAAAFALFAAVAFVEMRRMIGRAAARARMAAGISVALAGVFAGLLILLIGRFDMTLDIPVSAVSRHSERTLDILAEAHGDVAVTCFLPRSDARFRLTARTLRVLARAAVSQGGARLSLRFVDPSWDVGEASRIVRSGVAPGHVIFAYGHRRVVLPVDESFGERLCASSLLRLTMPPQRRSVRWTRGHGEVAFDDYGAFGMSDIARELSRDGYLNQSIDLSADAQIPSDCAMIVVAGARDEFSRAETARLDAYLKRGGRLLVLMNEGESGGVSALLPRWGLNVIPVKGPIRTLSGGDAIVSDFTDHPVTTPLKGMRLLLDNPVAFTPSAAVEVAATADRISFSALAKTGSACVAAVAERGAGTGNDLNFRPTRIVAVGDVSFVMNARIASQEHANRDFFLNAVAYLAGTEAMTASGVDGDVLVVGMDRAVRRRFLIVGAGLVPTTVMILFALVAFRRRRRG